MAALLACVNHVRDLPQERTCRVRSIHSDGRTVGLKTQLRFHQCKGFESSTSEKTKGAIRCFVNASSLDLRAFQRRPDFPPRCTAWAETVAR